MSSFQMFDIKKTDEALNKLAKENRTFVDMFIADREEGVKGIADKALRESAEKNWNAEKSKISFNANVTEAMLMMVPGFIALVEMCELIQSDKQDAPLTQARIKDLNKCAAKLKELMGVPKEKPGSDLEKILELLAMLARKGKL
ncbi:MAG: hypothetical protein KGL39_11810 [Patescibacteria group bacterium]|nr:hypothetical protein [Patescibacteria group bacterium]